MGPVGSDLRAREPSPTPSRALMAAEAGRGFSQADGKQVVWRWEGSRDHPRRQGAHTKPIAQKQKQRMPLQTWQVLQGTACQDLEAVLVHQSQRRGWSQRATYWAAPWDTGSFHPQSLPWPPSSVLSPSLPTWHAPPHLRHSWLLLSSDIPFRGACPRGTPPHPKLPVAEVLGAA